MNGDSRKQVEIRFDSEITMRAKDAFEATTQDPYFRDSDPEMMFEALLEKIRAVSFGDYLKREIVRKTSEDCDALEYLCAAFRKTGVPPSFFSTTAKIRSLAKNWLSQRVVNRDVVLLLGFALELTPAKVNELLMKALKESKLDPKDPFEVICWYCYQFQLPYSKFEELWSSVNSGSDFRDNMSMLLLESTVHVRKNMESIRTESELMIYLSQLDLKKHSTRQSISARRQFDLLYGKACTAAADMKTEMEKEDASIHAVRLSDSLSKNDRIYDFEKRKRIEKQKKKYQIYTAEEIKPADLESVLYSAIPKDRNGNMIPMKDSLLNIQFSGKRLNRQHLSRIMDGTDTINRFDIITLSFFVIAKETDESDDIKERYDTFVRLTNDYLSESDMDPLYVANPYECFLLMCMLTDDPLGSFSDVWELSYEAE